MLNDLAKAMKALDGKKIHWKSYTTGQGVGLKSGKRRRVPWLDVL